MFSKPKYSAPSFERKMMDDEQAAFLAEIAEIDVNLKSSCIACPFVAVCDVTDARASPDLDVLLGTYRFLALKEKCLV